MNVNPYESPGEPETELEDVRPAVTAPVESRAVVRIIRAYSLVIGVSAGSLLGMAFMFVMGNTLSRGNLSLNDLLVSVVFVGGTAGAHITLAGISILRAWDKAAHRRVNNRQAENEEQYLTKYFFPFHVLNLAESSAYLEQRSLST